MFAKYLFQVNENFKGLTLEQRQQEKNKNMSSDTGIARCRKSAEQLPVDSLKLLHSVLFNILAKPDEEKFRKIKVTNPKFKSRILDIQEAFEILKLVGFIQDGDWVKLPMDSTNVNLLKQVDTTIVYFVNSKGNHTSNDASGAMNGNGSLSNGNNDPSSPVGLKDVDVIEKRMRELKIIQEKRKEEKRKMKAKLEADKKERKHLPTGVSSKKMAKPSEKANVNRFADIGVDLNAKG